jgi:hypothetical protein
MNSQFGQGKRQHKTEKNEISPAKGWFFSGHTKRRAHQKQTPREMVSLCYQSKV